MNLSIIICTYNRGNILKKCLESIRTQDYKKGEIEIFIMDDGSTDNTRKIVDEISKNFPYQIFYYKFNHKGPAFLRNKAIELSHYEYILFLNDDSILEKNCIEEHVKYLHKYKDAAIIGQIKWIKELFSPDYLYFYKWLLENLPNYAEITDRFNCSCSFFITMNLSIKKSWLEKEQFDESFPYPALEDNELGYRLQKKGLKIIYNPNAICEHYHFLTPFEFVKKVYLVGKSALHLKKKEPELYSWVDRHWSLKQKFKRLLTHPNRMNLWEILFALSYKKGKWDFQHEKL